MAQVKIYTTNYCPYCKKAKAILDQKGATYEEIDLTDEPNMREMLEEITGGQRTVPQIFINAKHIGGCTDLEALNSAGKLDTLLQE